MTEPEDLNIHNRKLEHIQIVLDQAVEPHPSPFAKYRLPFEALPQVDLNKIDTKTSFFGYELDFPFVISSMTGGPERGASINKNLAVAAQKAKVGLGLGSMRVILRKPESLATFKVREYCPDVPIFANMGLVQLNYGYGAEEINYLIDAIDADGIFLHVNPLQEAIQPEGDTNFEGLLEKLAVALPQIKKPVIVKEVGTGLDFKTATKLRQIGIEWVDVSGSGGVSWVAVEGFRRQDKLGELFKYEGVATDQALIVNKQIEGLKMIAGGGLRSGLDIAKALILGAELGTAAKPLLAASLNSSQECFEILSQFKKELQIAMFACGAKDLEELKIKNLLLA